MVSSIRRALSWKQNNKAYLLSTATS